MHSQLYLAALPVQYEAALQGKLQYSASRMMTDAQLETPHRR